MEQASSSDRLVFTIFFSIIIHLSIILGVTFSVSSPPANKTLDNLDITLVRQKTVLAPTKADFLAQANNQGGGEKNEKSPDPSKQNIKQQQAAPTPTSALTVPNTVPRVASKSSPDISHQQDKKTDTPSHVNKNDKTPSPKKVEKPQTSPTKAIVKKTSARRIQAISQQAEVRQLDTSANTKKPKPSTHNLKLPNQAEIALLERQFAASAEALSKRPKKRRISAATKQYASAAYMKSWEMKIERIGNFNYPQEAKRKGINGSLMLTVDIKPDGSVPIDGITISRSSGSRVLDDAAVRIVRLGAPYASIPKDVLQGNDMLSIIRTWRFETNAGLSTR